MSTFEFGSELNDVVETGIPSSQNPGIEKISRLYRGSADIPYSAIGSVCGISTCRIFHNNVLLALAAFACQRNRNVLFVETNSFFRNTFSELKEVRESFPDGIFVFASQTVKDLSLESKFESLKDIELALNQRTGLTAQIMRSKQYPNEIKVIDTCTIERPDDKQKILRFVCSMLPRLMPGIFKDSPVTKEEQEALRSLFSMEDDGYKAFVASRIDTTDIVEKRTRNMMNRFFVETEQNRMKMLDKQQAEIQKVINGYKQAIDQELKKLRETTNLIKLACMGKEEGETAVDEALQFLKVAKNIRVVRADSAYMVFQVKSYWTNWHDDIYKQCIKGVDGLYYEKINTKYTHDQVESIYKAICEDRVLRLRLYALYGVDKSFNVIPGGRLVGYEKDVDDYLPNPHVITNSCLGSYTNDFVNASAAQDLMAILQVAVSSAGCVNLGERFTAMSMIRKLFSYESSNRRYLEAKDGTAYTVDEALEYLKKGEMKHD